jgi:hypothetical protein
VDVKEYFLDKVVRLRFVLENPLADAPDEMGVAPEEQSESVTVARACLDQK